MPNSKVKNRRVAVDPITVTLPDGSTINSTHVGDLDIPELPPEARTAHIFPDLKHHALISIGIFCDHGCDVHFQNHKVSVLYKGKEILQGPRDSQGLWRLEIPSDEQKVSWAHPLVRDTPQFRIDLRHSANLVMPSTSVDDAMTWLHGALFSPVPSTLIKAIKNNQLLTWPMLTVKNVKKHLAPSIATAMGHLDQARKNAGSTKKNKSLGDNRYAALLDEIENDDAETIVDGEDNEETDDYFPQQENPTGIPTDFVYASIETIPRQRNDIIHSDQTGKFPVASYQGNLYVMVVYCYDANAILVAPMKTRSKHDIVKAYRKILARLIKAGLKPKLQRFDNECSELLKSYMDSENIDYQLVPPGMHRRNAAERAIRTFKNHFIAGLASVDPEFPLIAWDELLDQGETSLNLLRASRINPKLSAYAQLQGQFNFDATPLAPPGMKIVTHNKPDQRASWAPHGAEGFYVGGTPEHYRCFRVFIPALQSTRVSDTLAFFPKKSFPTPHVSPKDEITLAAKDLITALEKPATPNMPLYSIGDPQRQALKQLSNIFNESLPGVPKATQRHR